MKTPMTPFEKALAWHTLGKAWSPNAPSVKHVDAILKELERVTAELEALRQTGRARSEETGE